MHILVSSDGDHYLRLWDECETFQYKRYRIFSFITITSTLLYPYTIEPLTVIQYWNSYSITHRFKTIQFRTKHHILKSTFWFISHLFFQVSPTLIACWAFNRWLRLHHLNLHLHAWANLRRKTMPVKVDTISWGNTTAFVWASNAERGRLEGSTETVWLVNCLLNSLGPHLWSLTLCVPSGTKNSDCEYKTVRNIAFPVDDKPTLYLKFYTLRTCTIKTWNSTPLETVVKIKTVAFKTATSRFGILSITPDFIQCFHANLFCTKFYDRFSSKQKPPGRYRKCTRWQIWYTRIGLLKYRQIESCARSGMKEWFFFLFQRYRRRSERLSPFGYMGSWRWEFCFGCCF